MLAREAMASAAVALYAAAVLPRVPPQATARDLALGLFCPPHSCPSFAPEAVQMSGQLLRHQDSACGCLLLLDSTAGGEPDACHHYCV